ncbi:MAG: threonine--tRNA ligase [Actinobacteria bacterium]|nr:threonine--tRNA ligase [Actinomycetota bacterium]NBY15533.1 threonine--tRNA ligase [Actinomycetota bacterium]
MVAVLVGQDKQSLDIEAGATAFDVVGDKARKVVVARVNGNLVDLSYVLVEGDVVEPVLVSDPDGLSVLRHSVAHIVAQATQEIFPQAKLGIGPPIKDGFFYDFGIETPFSPEDLSAIEKRSIEIINSGQKFSRRVTERTAAISELASEPFKVALLEASVADVLAEDVMEVGAGELTIYDNIDLRSGDKKWCDLCRGPHVPDTRYIDAKAVKIMRSSAAYWLGNQKNASMQRIYGTAWPTKEELKNYLTMLDEAAKRDHRRLGVDLDLFSFPDELGSGLAVFHPKGGIIRRSMEDYSRLRHEAAGYEFVYTPHITKGALFEQSGHLDWYKDGMFPAMHLDEEYHEDGSVKRKGQDYYLKPMNCPFHNLIFKSRGRSYRELPLRLFEFGSVYRYEKSGVVHGLTRVRGMTQDDAHIYCTKEQMPGELQNLLSFVLDLLRDYGLDDFYLELSTRNPEKSIGSDEEWEAATAALAEAAEKSGLDLVPDPGGAAFYGPKISVQARDAIGRTWQMSTIQVDFQLPARFDLEYQAADGGRARPIMIHRALFGSIERFFGVLLEHYAGAFPAWLAPVQVIGIPIASAHNDYLHEVAQKLRDSGVRIEVDDSDERMQKKIRNAQQQKVPFMLIAGDDDIAAGAVSFRYRDGTQENGIPVAQAVEKILKEIGNRSA